MSYGKTYGGRRWVWAAAAIVLLWGGVSVRSCPVPVFQYALENWSVDPYEITIYHRGTLSEANQRALALLTDAAARGDRSGRSRIVAVPDPVALPDAEVGDGVLGNGKVGGQTHANIKVSVHDLSENEDMEWPAVTASMPHMQVRYPASSRQRNPIWSGPFSAEAVQALLHSSVREKLASSLLDRKTAVWVLLDGKEPSKNDAAFDLLRKELARLERTLVLPSSATWQDQMVQIYDTISFEIVRLRRDDPQEQMLVKMLLMSEPDLVEFGAVPIAFPIYGRGLILHALVDKGINRWTVGDTGAFLAGPCSCQVKAGNPGLDLLMSVDWKANVEPLTAQTPAAPVGTGGFLRRLEEAKDEWND